MRLGRLLAQWYVMTVVFSVHAFAGGDSTNVSKSAISIASSRIARVFVDGDSIGSTPLTFNVLPGKHVLRLVPEDDVQSWAADPLADTIIVTANAPQSLSYTFKSKLFLNSQPTGAAVYALDSLLGTTPLIITSSHLTFTFRKEGFEESTVALTEPKNITVNLKRAWQSGADSSIFREPEATRSSLRLYLAGTTTILAGAASAYFKVKADNSYESYLRTGNQTQLSDTERYDTAAGIAIAATQISLGLFTYFILSE
jgi:hypothetical protein